MNFKRLVSTIDLHVAGEPLGVITGGLPEINGDNQPERRKYCINHLDSLRKTLMNEPRGHHGMYGCIITPPVSKQADFGVLFLHNEGWSTMCGHGIIAVVTMLIETGQFEVKDNQRKFVIDSPAGEVIAYATCDGQDLKHVSFENVPSFVFKVDFPVEIDGDKLTVDIVFGGAFYALVDSDKFNLQLNFEDLPKLQDIGMKIKQYIESNLSVQHPIQKDLIDIYGTIFTGEPSSEKANSKNVTIFADHQVDRSPCGTGTSARVASLYKNGELKEKESFFHQSITGGIFEGKVLKTAKIDSYDAVIPEVSGTASITGFHQFVVDERDFMPEGFML